MTGRSSAVRKNSGLPCSGSRDTSVQPCSGLRKNSVLGGFVVLLLTLANPALADPQPSAPDPEAVAATIGGEPVKVREVLEFMRGVLADNKMAPQSMALVEAQSLAQLVDRKLVGLFLDENNISASNAEVDEALKKLEDQAAGQPGGLKGVLNSRGVSMDSFRRQLAWDVRWAKYLTKTIGEAELRDYFDKHREDFDGTQRRVSHILLRPNAARSPAAVAALETKALAIREEITSGQMSFAAAAKRYSDGPSRLEGGDLGFIPRHNRMAEAFSAAAFKLKKGEISQPVVTPFGLHLIECTDIKPGNQSWQDARSEIARAVARSTFDRLADQMRSKVKVEYGSVLPHVDPATGHLAK